MTIETTRSYTALYKGEYVGIIPARDGESWEVISQDGSLLGTLVRKLRSWEPLDPDTSLSRFITGYVLESGREEPRTTTLDDRVVSFEDITPPLKGGLYESLLYNVRTKVREKSMGGIQEGEAYRDATGWANIGSAFVMMADLRRALEECGWESTYNGWWKKRVA